MHLALDVREACDAHRTGKGQWTYGFVSELLTRHHECTLFSDCPLPSEWTKASDRTHVQILREKGLAWHFAVAKLLLKNESIDAYVSPASYIVPFLLAKKKKCIPVVHDLIAFRSEPHDNKATFIERLTLKRTVRHAAHILTVSETTKYDLLAKFPAVSSVTPIFAGPIHAHSASSHKGKTIVCVGTLSPRKNQLRLIQAYARLSGAVKKEHPLVLVGRRGWNDDEIVKLASKTPGVEWKQYLSDAEVEKLLEDTAVFAFPTLYEGFGLPVLDALRRGIPVLTSDRGSVKEVAGDVAVFIDPEHVSSIHDGLSTLLADAALRKRLQTDGPKRAELFSWKRTVDLFESALAKIDNS